jgi:hypothetical protein
VGLVDLVRLARSKAAEPHTSVRIPDGQVADATVSPLPAFEPGGCYLEVRLAQMHLRDRREWWRSFLPLSSVVTEFQSGAERPTVPFVVGAATLGDQVQGGPDYVELLNKRVAGPVPYTGDQVRIFAALYRTAYQNWAKQALSMLEGIAKQLDVTRLSSLLTVAPGVVAGLESVLGMEDVELRLGVDRDLVPGGAEDGDGALRPGWMVMFGPGAAPPPARQLWVRNDRLHLVDDEFRGRDFLLLHVRALRTRDDYHTFDFHRVQWARVQDRLWEFELDGAQTAFGAFTASLMQCADLTRDQRKNLWANYQLMYREDLEQVKQVHDSGRQRLSSTEVHRNLSPGDVAGLAASPAPESQVVAADRLLAAFAS